MSEGFRYHITDEPRAGPLSRFALPPLLVFMVATFFQPWGYLLISVNAILLNGPKRNREILFSLIPLPVYFSGLAGLNYAVSVGWVPMNLAYYLFALVIAAGLTFAAFAYVSQAETTELRRYLDGGA